MKILHILTGFYPIRGGVETLIESLSDELEKCDGISSVFVAPRYWKSRPNDFQYKSRRVYSIDMIHYGRRSITAQLKGAKVAMKSFNDLRGIIENEKPDIVHVHGVFELFAAATKIANDLRIPIIHHIHGELPRNFDERKQAILRASTSIIAVSNKVARSIAMHAPDVEISVIPNGVADPGRANSFDKISRITFIGRLEEQKGLHIAMQAFAKSIQRYPHLHLNIVGLGDHIYFQELSNNLGISGSVTFFGRCSHFETLKVLKSSQLVIVPSTSIEGFSMVAAEANIMSLPVIASDVGGLSNTILHQVTGLLVPPSDAESLQEAINFYLENPKSACKHGAAGRARMLGEFSIMQYSKLIENYYRLQVG